MINSTNLLLINGKKYAGNPYTSFNFIAPLLFYSISLVGFLSISKKDILMDIYFAAWVLIGIIYISTQMHYFLIDENNLIIRNHYQPWKRIVIGLDNIKEATIERRFRKSNSLAIVTNDVRKRVFGAGSLRNKHWDDLVKDLNFIGIPAKKKFNN